MTKQGIAMLQLLNYWALPQSRLMPGDLEPIPWHPNQPRGRRVDGEGSDIRDALRILALPAEIQGRRFRAV
jgi:hypothetical protein